MWTIHPSHCLSSDLSRALDRTSNVLRVGSSVPVKEHTCERCHTRFSNSCQHGSGALVPPGCRRADLLRESANRSQTSMCHRLSSRLKIEVPKMAEQILDVLVPDRVEQLVKLPNTVSDDGIRQQTAGYITVIPVSQDVKELVVVFRVFSQDRIQQRTVEQTIPVTSLAEKIVEFPVIQTEERTQQGVNTHAQHVVNTVEVERPEIFKQTGQKIIIQDKINQVTQHVEVPLSQFNDKVVDNPVVAQRQIYMVMTVQKSIEIPQLQVTDQVVDVPVVVVAQVPQVHVEKKTVEITQLQPVAQVPRVLVVEKTTEIPQFRVIDKVVDVPVVSVMQVPRVCAVKKTAETPQLQEVDVPVVFVVQAPLVQVRVVIKTVEDSWFQIVEKTAEAPQTQTIQVNQTSEGLGMECNEGHELMLQGNDLVCVVKDPFVDVKAMTKG